MKFGLEDRHWEEIERLLIKPIKDKNIPIWIFGSRARGDHKAFSDLDVLISDSPGIDHKKLRQIKENLEESNLPIKVDIVLESELAESYKPSATKERIRI